LHGKYKKDDKHLPSTHTKPACFFIAAPIEDLRLALADVGKASGALFSFTMGKCTRGIVS